MKYALLASLLLALSAPTLTAQDSASTGKVYMLNQNRFGSFPADGFKVDGKVLKADRKKYSYAELSAGKHTLEFQKKTYEVEIQPGKAYYFKPSEHGLGWGGWSLERISEDQATFAMQAMSPDTKNTVSFQK